MRSFLRVIARVPPTPDNAIESPGYPIRTGDPDAMFQPRSPQVLRGDVMNLSEEQLDQATTGKPVRLEIPGRGVFFLVNVRFFEKIRESERDVLRSRRGVAGVPRRR